ncbi:MAG: hypothetical protein Alpg2KO_05710 [Alphaproteobacteria bacterium]
MSGWSDRLRRFQPFRRELKYKSGAVAFETVASSMGAAVLQYLGKHHTLSELDLSGIDLRLRDNLRGVHGYSARFDGAKFGPTQNLYMRDSRDYGSRDMSPPERGIQSANLEATNFTGSSFRNAVMTMVIARNADFTNCDMTNADLRNADFTGAKFEGANLTGVRIDSRTLFSEGAFEGARNIDKAVIVDFQGRAIEHARLTERGIVMPLRPSAPTDGGFGL